MLTALIFTTVLGAGMMSMSADCTASEAINGTCYSTSNSGERVDVGGSLNSPGSSRPNGGPSNRPSNPDAKADSAPKPEEVCPPVIGCRGNYTVVTLPDVTLADIASFVPAKPELSGEPAGLGVVGMPTNVVAAASEQRIAGTLFDFAVTVRFVPSGFRFAYGDGSTRTSGTGGTSWSALGQAEFTPTDTSHVYRTRGTYPVSVTVLYSSSVDFGTGNWRPVPGFVEATTGGYDVRVVEVHTGLVDRTCIENPGGPGC
ncbi:hypothetical protein ACLQ2Q_04195 [Microbacterium sp. DT81.1]|uniref:hypothetical protein n=1 Tax=Microbacterium sp. DT81.1 TaxID=3393413 RepID=UPI003CEB7EDC